MRTEGGTFARLKELRQTLLEPSVKEHHGTIFKLMGDGFLVEFGSVVDAVACAAALQSGLAERNRAVAENERILLRVGVNLGDVIVEGEDRYGEGVNIAARLEQLADPGGICVSQPVIDQLSNKLPLVFETIGEHKVKNIAKPVHAYRAKLDGVAKTRRIAMRSRAGWAAGIALAVALAAAAWYFSFGSQPRAPPNGPPSIAVLALDNLSDDTSQGFLADGISEDLTTELARIPGLFVISRNAAFGYKGKNIKYGQIAAELGVRSILEGSIRRVGDDLRINAQLIDMTTGGHLWAERFDGAWSDIFTLQDKIVGEIAKALQLRLVAGQHAAQIAGGTDNPAAYEAYLRGLEAWNRNRPEDFPVAARHYEQAIALDGELSGLLAMKDLPFKNYADLDRVFEGLRKAGVPELPFGFDAKSKDRLTAAEIRALFYGHEIQGCGAISGDPYWRATAADGSYRATLGARSVTGVSWFEGDVMCNANQLSPRGCRAVFRNPAGTFEAKNEYLIFRHRDRFEFSVVK